MEIDKEYIEDIVTGLKESANSNRLKDIIDYLGINVISVDSIDKRYGFYLKGSKESIFISRECDERLRDFVLAHELGHAILHDEVLTSFSIMQSTKTRIELEADYFAMYLLDIKIERDLDYTEEEYSQLYGVHKDIIKYL